MTTRIEQFDQSLGRWVRYPDIEPGDPRGSMVNVKSDGSTEIFMFRCTVDDEETIIYLDPDATYSELDGRRIVAASKNAQEVKVLKHGDSHLLKIRSLEDPRPVATKITHIKTR